MARIALFPGSFDPITIGHMDIIERALPLFDKVLIGVGINSTKAPMFNVDTRILWIHEIFKDNPKVDVTAYTGLTIDHCKLAGANFILRGIRYTSDFEYEKSIADANRTLSGIETVFLTCLPKHTFVASTLVRELIKNEGDIREFVHDTVLKDYLIKRIPER